MNNEIADIFKDLLQGADANPDKDINELIKEALVKNGLSTEALDEAMNALAELEGINESAQSLADAREEGETRSKWLENQLADMTSEMDDETADRFCTDVAEQMDKTIKNIVSDNTNNA